MGAVARRQRGGSRHIRSGLAASMSPEVTKASGGSLAANDRRCACQVNAGFASQQSGKGSAASATLLTRIEGARINKRKLAGDIISPGAVTPVAVAQFDPVCDAARPVPSRGRRAHSVAPGLTTCTARDDTTKSDGPGARGPCARFPTGLERPAVDFRPVPDRPRGRFRRARNRH